MYRIALTWRIRKSCGVLDYYSIPTQGFVEGFVNQMKMVYHMRRNQ